MRKPGQPRKPESELLKKKNIRMLPKHINYLNSKGNGSKHVRMLIEKDMNKSVDKY